MSIDKFIIDISAELISAVNNNYEDNHDHYRYGALTLPKKKISIKEKAVKKLNARGFYNTFNNQILSTQIKNTEFPFSDFFYLYELLEDAFSKELLIRIIAYRMLGHTKIKLPLSTPAFWIDQKRIEEHQSKEDVIQIGFMNQNLPFTNLEFLGVPLKMYYSALGINIDFIIKQYECKRDNVIIQAEPGDVVIDAGGCFGDTALYFANKVGTKGLVKAFEFIPGNIEIFNKNIALNPALAPLIELVKNPLWNESNLKVFFADNGPGSKVALDIFDGYTGNTTTLTIDDCVNSSNLVKVDFIKMDIEGAETNALAGAAETIKKYKPKLAIALYHSTQDFDRIPRWINSLDLGYQFYLTHSTIYQEETMLFAKTTR